MFMSVQFPPAHCAGSLHPGERGTTAPVKCSASYTPNTADFNNDSITQIHTLSHTRTNIVLLLPYIYFILELKLIVTCILHAALEPKWCICKLIYFISDQITKDAQRSSCGFCCWVGAGLPVQTDWAAGTASCY